MKIRFACGHMTEIAETVTTPPICGCGNTQITRVQSRPPRFVGACQGPYAESKALEPAIVNLVTGKPLTLTALKD